MRCFRCSQGFLSSDKITVHSLPTHSSRTLLASNARDRHPAGARQGSARQLWAAAANAKREARAVQADSDDTSNGKHAHELAEAAQRIRRQQEAGAAPAYDLQSTQRLVETAMLAAVGGIAYTLAVVLKLQSYLGYLQPMPVVVAAMRWGPAAARKAMSATFLLLLVLLGPLQALTYVLNQGLMAACLGACWSAHVHWGVSIPAAAAVRVAGTLAYIGLSSWTVNENLFALLMTNVYSLLDQFSALLGASGAPPPLVIKVVIGSLLGVNAVLYVALMHVLYAVLLRAMGYSVRSVPRLVERLVFRQPR